MSLSKVNKLVYNNNFFSQLKEIIYIFLYEYQDEFAAAGFLREYYASLEKLKSVSEYDGRPVDEEMAKNGFRRILLKKYKYVVVYYYDSKNKTVYIDSIHHERSNYFRFFK